MKTIEEEFIDVIISKIKVGWFWKNLIRMGLTKGLDEALKAMHRKHIAIYYQVIDLMQKYNKKDTVGMIDESADILAEIVKLLFYPKLKR
jgi:hypothetical protein